MYLLGEASGYQQVVVLVLGFAVGLLFFARFFRASDEQCKTLSAPVKGKSQPKTDSCSFGGTPPCYISNEDWPEIADLVSVCYMKPAPDVKALQHLICSCNLSLKTAGLEDTSCWPRGWFEPIDDLFWLKFLLANQFDVGRAVKSAHLYIKSHGAETGSSPSVLMQHLDGRIFAPFATRDGMLVTVLRPRYHRHVEFELLEDWFVTVLDSVIAWNMLRRRNELSSRRNKLERYVFIIDLEGASRANSDMSAAKKLVSLCTSRYPDFMQTAYVINTPPALMTLWSFARRLLDHRMQQKHVFLGRGDTSLRKLIAEEDLPVSLGGIAPEWLPPQEMSTLDRLGVFAPLILGAQPDAISRSRLNSESPAKGSWDDVFSCFGGACLPCLGPSPSSSPRL